MRKKYLEAIEQAGWVHTDMGDGNHLFVKHYDALNAEVLFTIFDHDFYNDMMNLTFNDIVWSCPDGTNPVPIEQQINFDITVLKGRLKEANGKGQMRLSEFITFLQEAAKGSDPMVDFSTERWSKDLEFRNYHPAFFENAPVENGKMTLFFSMDGEE